MSNSDAGAYVDSFGSDVTDLSVQCLNGEGCMMKITGSCPGWEVYQMVSKQLVRKKGAKITLHHLNSPLILHKELQDQGWARLQHSPCCLVHCPRFASLSGRACLLEGVIQIKGASATKYLHHLTFGKDLNKSLEQVTRLSQSSDLHIWQYVDPELGTSHAAKQHSDLDIWRQL